MANYLGDTNMAGLLATLLNPPMRRKIFISYHHGNDQAYYEEFSRFFHDQYEAVYDNSIERKIDSDNVQYVMQRIRDKHITGTSCTVVLIGSESYERKYVDWEIKATLDKQHGLIGVALPTHKKTYDGKVIVPDRFYDNLVTGYAGLVYWEGLTVQALTQQVDLATAKPKNLIDNSREMRKRNG